MSCVYRHPQPCPIQHTQFRHPQVQYVFPYTQVCGQQDAPSTATSPVAHYTQPLSTRLPGALRPPAPVQLDFRMASRTTSGYLPTPTTSSPADRTSQYPPSHPFHPRRFPPETPPRGTPQALPPSSRLPGQPTPAPRVRTPSPYSRPRPPLMFSSSSTPRSRCGHPTVAHPANPSANVQLRTSRRSR